MTPDRMADLHAAGFAGGEVWSAMDFEKMLDGPHIRAVIQGNAGFALLRVLPPEAELLTIVIDPACQGEGLGAALMAEVLSEAAKAGASRIFLEVGAANETARALYARAGFAAVGLRKGYYRRPEGRREDAIVLAMTLDKKNRGDEKPGAAPQR